LLHRLLAGDRFTAHLPSGLRFEKGANAAAYDFVVVSNQNACRTHVDAPSVSIGSTALIVVPEPMPSEEICSSPPSSRRRSRMPVMPTPGRAAPPCHAASVFDGMPRPWSRTSRVADAGSRCIEMCTLWLPE